MAFDLNVKKKKKEFDYDLCLFCQEKNDGSFVKNFKESSLDNVMQASIRRQDSINSLLINDETKDLCKWHRNCYSVYVSKQNVGRCEKRLLAKQNEESLDLDSTDKELPCTSNTLVTRSVVPKCDFKKCIFCQQTKKKGDRQTFRLSEVEAARRLLALCKERQDNVFVRLSTCTDENDIFAADVLYHRKCFLEYGYEKEKSVSDQKQNIILDDAFTKLILEIDEDLNEKCFEVSFLTERLRQLSNCDELIINNRVTKNLLVTHYGESLLFSHSSDQSKSSVVFKTCFKPNELVKRIRYMSEKCVNTETLRNDAKSKSFNLNGFLCNDSSINSAFDKFKFSSAWESFFSLVVGKERMITEDIKRKCISVYMDLHSLINERDITPKHVALAQCIHHYTRSKLIISLLNRLGHCISYKTLSKLDNQVLTHIVNSSNDVNIPVPSNIARDPSVFLHGAIDNDDFKEDTFDGKATTHVTAMVLYQPSGTEDRQQLEIEKIPVPETGLKVPDDTLIECQVLKKCPPINRKPEHFPKPCKQLCESTNTQTNCGDLIWVLSRLDLDSQDNGLILPKHALSPGWTPFNQVVSISEIPVTKIGFCTIFPAPPTTNDCVYTVMNNFLKINDQLGQKYAVLSCDMAVYLMAKLVQLQTTGFERLFLRIGTFHLAKNFLSIIGQYVLDSGFVDIVIECGIYGENTIKSVLHGTHYNRGIRVHKLVYEACRRLQFKQFLEQNIETEEYEVTKELMKKLQTYVMDFEEEASAVFELITEEHSNFFNRFKTFLDEKAANNETFKFWNQYCQMVELLLDCVKADRDGNWNLHINVVERMIPFCLLFNHYHYARGCVMYLEDMSNLPPELVNAFQQGHFTVKKQSGKFNSVAADHALEQSLIRSSKIKGGLIGISSNDHAVRKWCLLYHHKADVSLTLLNFCDLNQDPTGDVQPTHKEWSKNRVEKDEQDVQTMINFFLQHDNPFAESNTPLRNIVSGTLASSEMAASFLLNVEKLGQELYDRFQTDRMVKKIKGLFAPIQRNRVFSFNSLPKEENPKSKKSASDEESVTQTILLASQRNFSIDELMRHELMPYPPSLALENGHLRKSIKSELINVIESESHCNESLQTLEQLQNQVHIFDGMAIIHSIPNAVISKMACFEEFAKHQMTQIEKALNQRYTSRVDVVYDWYDNSSMKSVEHELRAGSKLPLVVKIHNDLTKTPTQWSRYLLLPENKKNLIQYISAFIMNNIHIPEGKILFLSGCFSEGNLCFSKKDTQVISKMPNLTSNHVEADTRMFLHVQDCLVSDLNIDHVIIHSPDTDVFVLGIRFWVEFEKLGCQGLWIRVGTGDKKRGLGCHVAASNLGKDLSKVLPALHAFTGCDTTSKISTKKTAFKYIKKHSNCYKVLLSLTVWPITEDLFDQLQLLYLQLTNKKGKTCDESRFVDFSTTQSAVKNLNKLSCTSDSYRLHILRCAAQLHFWENSLQAFIEPLDLTNYGYYKDENNKFRPLLMTLPATPASLVQPCKCKNCSKKTCSCLTNNSTCCSYCKCGDRCKNPLQTKESDEESQGEEDL